MKEVLTSMSHVRRFRGNFRSSSGLLKQDKHAEAIVHLFAGPPCGRCVLVDVDSLLLVIGQELPPIRKRLCVIGGHALEGFSIGLQKAQRAIIELLDLNLALMHLAVMETAKLYEVGELRFPSICPMMDMMTVHIPRVRTAGKPAAAITRI